MPLASADTRLKSLLSRCKSDPGLFNEAVLGRPRYWYRQEEICKSVVKNRITCSPAGNAIGKTYVAGGIISQFAVTHGPCKVIVAAPDQKSLESTLWPELLDAINGSRFPLGGRLKSLRWDLGDNWFVAGIGQGSVESKAGRHAGNMLVVVDEASGVSPQVHEAIDSLNASRLLYLGNPLRPEGKFYDLCEQSANNPHVNVIRIPSLESPDIGLDRSPRGMADKTFLDDMRHQYGESSIWWLSHILARFPGSLDDGLIRPEWLVRAGNAVHIPGGHARGSIDLAGGNGGNRSVIIIRDDNGVLAWDWSREWSLEDTARRAAAMSIRAEGGRPYRVEPYRWSFDSAGLGWDFNARLEAAGIKGAIPYRGNDPGGKRFTNLRSAAGWLLRQRLDPDRESTTPAGISFRPPPFAIPMDLLAQIRGELLSLRYHLAGPEKIGLEPKAEMEARLRTSPDLADTLVQAFAYPNA